jgi:hypothetical protein
VSLSEDVARIAEAAARYASPEEELAAVLPIEPASGQRVYLCAYALPDGTQSWLGFDEQGSPLTDRTLVRDAASIAALVEIAEEAAGVATGDDPRLASPAYLDSLGGAANGDVTGALQSALPAIDELSRDLELNYKLKLE